MSMLTISEIIDFIPSIKVVVNWVDKKAIVGFLFGLFSFVVVEKIKNNRELTPLIDIFIEDFALCWRNISSAEHIPHSVPFASATYSYKGVSGLNIQNIPNLYFPIHNTFLYETEGPKLIKHLNNEARRKYWKVYLLSKDVENLRVKINELGDEHCDTSEYKKIITSLSGNLFHELQEFEVILNKSYPCYVRIYRGSLARFKALF